jgi:hypothetical protein
LKWSLEYSGWERSRRFNVDGYVRIERGHGEDRENGGESPHGGSRLEDAFWNWSCGLQYLWEGVSDTQHHLPGELLCLPYLYKYNTGSVQENTVRKRMRVLENDRD